MPERKTKQQKLDEVRLRTLSDEFISVSEKLIKQVKRMPEFRRLETLVSIMYPDGVRLGQNGEPMVGVKPTIIVGYQGSAEKESRTGMKRVANPKPKMGKKTAKK